ncbi:MAG: methylated-DNA--[protein]-cysteine S-methyltransferase [Prevotella sp.]|jgi:O-6-methylguanine DNA methyltransferase
METIVYGFAESPFGSIIVARNSQGVCDLQFLGYDRHLVIHELGTRWGVYTPTSQNDDMAQQVERLIFESFSPTASTPLWEEIPLCPKGTEFQLKVWEELRRIPFGTTVSYQEVANRLGRPTAVRSVATAIAANPIAVLIPCHRVVHKDGSLGNYHWGTQLKQQLIDWEKRHLKK